MTPLQIVIDSPQKECAPSGLHDFLPCTKRQRAADAEDLVVLSGSPEDIQSSFLKALAAGDTRSAEEEQEQGRERERAGFPGRKLS